MSKMLDELREKLGTPEGKKYAQEYFKRIEDEGKIQDRHIDKIKEIKNIDVFIEKVIKKYQSDEYINKEIRLGYEPRNKLLYLLYEYASKYCERCYDMSYHNYFTNEAYYIGSYVIQLMVGQGSSIRIDKNIQKDREDKINDLLR